jgi:FG-GAP-like repeat
MSTRSITTFCVMFGMALAICACGGGNSSSPPTTILPPTVNLSITPTTISVGQNATLTWSSTNSVSCTASGSWSGSQGISGTQNLSPTKAASLSYALACQNSAGITTAASATLTVNAAAPSVTIVASPNAVTPGSPSTLTWSATSAQSCSASGAWAGSQGASGTAVISQSVVGNYTYSLSCTGPGGTASNSASLLVSNIKPSSYENKNGMGNAPVSLSALGVDNAFGVADFFHDGSTAVVFHTLEYDPNNPATYQNYGHIHFFKQDQYGTWTDETPTLLATTTGCIHPRKAVVADFNRDAKPDVFFACHGIDAPPFPGEQPHLLLSQADGTYLNVVVPITCYCHSGSAADINGDGFADVLVTDTMVAQTPFFLMNNGDGTFTADYSRLPASLKGQQIFTSELIDLTGSGLYDVFLAGNEPGTTSYPQSEFGPEVLPNDGAGHFISKSPVNLLVGGSFGLALDVLFQNNYVYLLKVNPQYTSSEIQKISYPAAQGSVIYSHTGAYPNGSSWIDWIIPYNGQIMSENATFDAGVPQ